MIRGIGVTGVEGLGSPSYLLELVCLACESYNPSIK